MRRADWRCALLRTALLALALCNCAPAHAADGRSVQLLPGRDAAPLEIKDRLRGRQYVDYLVRAQAGQTLAAELKTSNRSAYFNMLAPGSDSALFIGSTSGDRAEVALPAAGTYTLRVYLMRSAARRNESAAFTLSIALSGGARPAIEAPFDRTIELQGVRFRVTSANQGSINRLRIEPAGLDIDNSPVERDIDGTVTGAEAADLDADGSPEIYVYVTSAGSGSYGSLVAFSANRRKSLSEIVLPPLAPGSRAAKGYRGHDEFAVVESVLVRRFPVFRSGDTNSRASGGTRQVQYRLEKGEATWRLRPSRTVEY